MADLNGINGKATWLWRAILIAFITWAIADRVKLGDILLDLRERLTVLETTHGFSRRD